MGGITKMPILFYTKCLCALYDVRWESNAQRAMLLSMVSVGLCLRAPSALSILCALWTDLYT